MPSINEIDRATYHKVNCAKICLLCLKKKQNMRNITTKMKSNVQQVIPNYNIYESNVPTVICDTCKIAVYKCVKTGNLTVKTPYYSQLKLINISTRSCSANVICDCDLCNIVHNGGGIKNLMQYKCNSLSIKKPNKKKNKISEKCKKNHI